MPNEKIIDFCSYDPISIDYDKTRKPVCVYIGLGFASVAPHNIPLHQQDLLDIGCGTGTFLHNIMKHYNSVTGLEYNGKMIEQARKLLDSTVQIKQGQATQIPFADNSFHTVCMNQVIHHFPNDNNFEYLENCFKEVSRVLKPGGSFIINTSTPEQQADAFWWLSLFPKASSRICNNFPPLNIIKTQLRNTGFAVKSDSITVPLEQTLMDENIYLKNGVLSGLDSAYRYGDSSWEMANITGELEQGLAEIENMIKNNSDKEWLLEREKLRVSVGQSTFITIYKPL